MWEVYGDNFKLSEGTTEAEIQVQVFTHEQICRTREF